MLEIRAVVVSVQGKQAEIVPSSGGGCGQCDSAGGCGSSKLSQMFCSSSEARKFVVQNPSDAKVGDEVEVSLPDGILLRSTWRVYGLPLLLLLSGGLLGSVLAGETASRDFCALGGAVSGFLLAIIWHRLFTHSDTPLAVARPISVTRIPS